MMNTPHKYLLITFMAVAIYHCASTVIARAAIPATGSLVSLTPEEKAWIKSNPIVNVGNSPLLPYHFREDGIDTGYQVEVTEAMLRMVGLTPRYHWSEKLKDSLDGMLRGDVDMALNLIRTPERVANYGLSENSYNLSFAIFAQTGRTDISGPDSLRGKRIATYKGYALEKRLIDLLPESPIVQAEGYEGMFRLVASGKADAFVQELHSGKYSLRRFWINNVEAKELFVMPGMPTLRSHSYGVRKNLPILKSILDKAYRAMGAKDPSREALYNATDVVIPTYFSVFARSQNEYQLKRFAELTGLRIGYKRGARPTRSLLEKLPATILNLI